MVAKYEISGICMYLMVSELQALKKCSNRPHFCVRGFIYKESNLFDETARVKLYDKMMCAKNIIFLCFLFFRDFFHAF